MYLGSPGRMIRLKCPVAQRETAEDGYRFVLTLEGRRKAQVVPGGPRVWDISVGQLTTPEQVGTLMEFASGAWGPGPFWFIPGGAAVVNLLTPDDVLRPAPTGTSEPGGPMRLEDGTWAATSRASINGGGILWRNQGIQSDPPVLPGVPVTVSAYVEGQGAFVLLQWFDDNAAYMGEVSSSSVTSAVGVRQSVTATTPAGAAYVRVSARNALRAARPAVTWTDEMTQWGEGRGCAKAVISQTSRDLVRAIPGMTVFSDLSFTVTEVG